MNKNETFLFPKELSNTWHVTDIIYFSKDHTICRVQNINTRLDYIMKVYSSRCFSKRKFEAVSDLTDRYFITPKTRLSIRHTEYIFFPAVETLKDILYHSGMSFHDILCLGINLIEAVQLLSRNGIYEADISPNNIYRNAKGNFCLGDLPLEKSPIFGTPPFIAPECMDKQTPPLFSVFSRDHNASSSGTLTSAFASGSYPSGTPVSRSSSTTSSSADAFTPGSLSTRSRKQDTRRKQFETAMQYSICSLLLALCKLQKDFYFEEMQNILTRGTSDSPSDRYTSLDELKHVFATLSSHEIPSNESLLLLHRKNHPLFHTKTLPVPKSGHSITNYAVGILLMASIICFIVVLHRYNHMYAASAPTNHISAAQRFTSVPSSSTAVTADRSSSEMRATASDNSSEQTAALNDSSSAQTSVEVDIQKHNLYSFSTAVKNIDNAADVTCLYAGNNHFSTLDNITELPHLQELYVNENRITDITGINACPSLTTAVLSCNDIRDISTLSDLTSLEYLDLSGNRHLSQLEALYDLDHLQILNISNTSVSKKQYRQLCKKLPACNIIY